MGTPFISEIKIISWNFAPKGWAFCNGQLLPINQNQALFALLGTTYGGNGQTNFALPDLRGRAPVHNGPQTILGQRGGEVAHTVTMSELPAHNHFVNASTANGDTTTPASGVLASANNTYTAAANLTTLAPESVSSVGGSQPHNNLQPLLVLNFIIALIGVFPSRN